MSLSKNTFFPCQQPCSPPSKKRRGREREDDRPRAQHPTQFPTPQTTHQRLSAHRGARQDPKPDCILPTNCDKLTHMYERASFDRTANDLSAYAHCQPHSAEKGGTRRSLLRRSAYRPGEGIQIDTIRYIRLYCIKSSQESACSLFPTASRGLRFYMRRPGASNR